MNQIWRQVRKARWRLDLQRFLETLTWWWFAFLACASLTILFDKYRPMGLSPVWHVVLALAAGALGAAATTWWRRPSALDAAVEIDRRFALRERVSSSLALRPAERDSEIGVALVRDAERRVDKIELGEKFGLRLSRWSWAPLLPGVAAFLLALFFNPATNQQQAQARQQGERKQIRTSTTKLEQRLAERRKQAEQAGLEDARNLFQELEQGAKELSKSESLDRQKTLVRMNDLAKDLAGRREALGGNEKLRQQLNNQFRNLPGGPAQKFAHALKKGDFKQALRELEHLQEKLQQGQLDDAAKQQLAQQLQQMQDKLQKLATAQQEQREALQKQIAEHRAAGREDQAQQLQRELDKLNQQQAATDQASQMAQKLGQAQECLNRGDAAGAAAQMQALRQELTEMARQSDEAEAIEAALDEIADAKDAMACSDCLGEGCENCRGVADSDRSGRGDGLGEGSGRGDRPEERTATGQYDTKVKQKIGKGSAVVVDMVEGPNVQGHVQDAIDAEFAAAASSESDPLTDQPLPREAREHARKYFESLRDGQ